MLRRLQIGLKYVQNATKKSEKNQKIDFFQNHSKTFSKVPDGSGGVLRVPGDVYHHIMASRSPYKKFLKSRFLTFRAAFLALKLILP